MIPIIAPLWADIDIRPADGGNIWYRHTDDAELLRRAQVEIRDALLNRATFTPTSLFIATWDHVGYFSRRTDLVCKIRYAKFVIASAFFCC